MYAEEQLTRRVGPGGCALVRSRDDLRETLELARGRVPAARAGREMADMLRHLVGDMVVTNADVIVGRAFCTVHSDKCTVPGCDSHGHLPGSCATCGGSRFRAGRGPGNLHRYFGQGLGEAISDAMCPTCHGTGRRMCPSSHSVGFAVPKGVRLGHILEGEDEQGQKHWGTVSRIKRLEGVPKAKGGTRAPRLPAWAWYLIGAAALVVGLLMLLSR